MIGLTVSHYRILGPLGKGGMGVVYRGEDVRLGRPVAIKFLPERWNELPKALSRFQREARAASALNHPNLLTLYDIGEHEGRPYLVMELLEGESLQEVLAGGQPLGAEEIRDLLLQLARGLEAAHRQGILHRDLKPSNIFLTRQGQVKILDFGLAKQVLATETEAATQTALTSPGMPVGTVSYMSPEQALGKPLDQRSDLFSLGIVLYEMATGQRPFQGSTVTSTLNALIHERPEPLQKCNPAIPLELARVAQKLLAKDPANRYSSASELIADLIEPQRRTRPALWVQLRRRRLWLPISAAILVLLALSAVVLRNWPPLAWPEGTSGEASYTSSPPEVPVVAVLPLANLGADSSMEPVALGIAHNLITTLSSLRTVTMISPGASLAYTSREVPTRQVARELGASYVVTGALQQAGERVRVTLNLIDRNDSVAWGGDAEGSRDHLFSLQHQLAAELSQGLRLVLTEADRVKLSIPPTENREAYAEYLQGQAYLERPDVPGNLERAAGLFESAIGKDPDFALAYAGLGQTFWAKYERTREAAWTEKARKAVEKAAELSPEEGGVRYSLAVIYQGTGRSEEAIRELRHTLRLQPNSDEAYRLLGEILASQGQREEAFQAFHQAIQIRPNYWGNHRALGLAYFDARRYPEAVRSFQRITELQPDLSWGFQLLGVAHHSAGNLEAARTNYERALELGPTASAYSNLGTLYYRQSQYAKAAGMYEKALELRSESAATHRNLGDAYRSLGRTQEAEGAYLQAVELARNLLQVNPKDARAKGMLAVYEAKLGRMTEALLHAGQAVESAPEDGQVLYRQAVVLALAGQRQEALAALSKALAQGYSPSEAAIDEDLASLRSSSEFRRLLARSR